MRKYRNHVWSIVIGFCIIVAAASAPIYAGTADCTHITSLPYTIERQGVYCLTANLETSMTPGNAITINTHNVVLDLNGHKLSGHKAGTDTQAYGIYGLQRKNITIKNGTVRGFMCGIWLDDDPPHTTSEGHIIENIRADANTYAGIKVVGCKNTIRNSKVISTGGSTYGSVNSARGILVSGPGNKIINNDIFDTKEQTSGHTFGVLVSGAYGSLVEGNRIENSALGKGMSYGIYIITSDDVLVKNNRISKMNFGVYYSGSTVKYGDNIIIDVTTPYMSDTHIEK
jgi:hypothetical protein